MKQTILFILLTFQLCAYAQQEVDFSLTPNGDTTEFTVTETVTINTTTFRDTRRTGFTPLAVQRFMYNRITNAYQQAATAFKEYQNALQSVANLRRELALFSLENYNADQVARFDSTYITNYWELQTPDSTVFLSTQFRDGLTTVLRDTTDNSVFGVIIPLSPDFIILRVTSVSPVRDIWLFRMNNRVWITRESRDFYRFIRN